MTDAGGEGARYCSPLTCLISPRNPTRCTWRSELHGTTEPHPENEDGHIEGVEDGFDNSGVIKKSLIPRQWACSKCGDLLLISETSIIATAFGHVHGVYKAGNVKLQPELLGQFQVYVSEKLFRCGRRYTLFIVSHSGLGSVKHIIATALDVGVVKMYMYN